jgi:hypothetical protein
LRVDEWYQQLEIKLADIGQQVLEQDHALRGPVIIVSERGTLLLVHQAISGGTTTASRYICLRGEFRERLREELLHCLIDEYGCICGRDIDCIGGIDVSEDAVHDWYRESFVLAGTHREPVHDGPIQARTGTVNGVALDQFDRGQ